MTIVLACLYMCSSEYGRQWPQLLGQECCRIVGRTLDGHVAEHDAAGLGHKDAPLDAKPQGGISDHRSGVRKARSVAEAARDDMRHPSPGHWCAQKRGCALRHRPVRFHWQHSIPQGEGPGMMVP